MAFSQILVVLLGMPFLRLLSSRHYIFKQSIDFSISWPAESSGVLLTQQGAHAVVFLRAFFVCSAQLFTWAGGEWRMSAEDLSLPRQHVQVLTGRS